MLSRSLVSLLLLTLLAGCDTNDWWDHSFAENPEKLFIEARPGGGFYEIFDTQGNGARHATVIYAERGKMLRRS